MPACCIAISALAHRLRGSWPWLHRRSINFRGISYANRLWACHVDQVLPEQTSACVDQLRRTRAFRMARFFFTRARQALSSSKACLSRSLQAPELAAIRRDMHLERSRGTWLPGAPVIRQQCPAARQSGARGATVARHGRGLAGMHATPHGPCDVHWRWQPWGNRGIVCDSPTARRASECTGPRVAAPGAGPRPRQPRPILWTCLPAGPLTLSPGRPPNKSRIGDMHRFSGVWRPGVPKAPAGRETLHGNAVRCALHRKPCQVIPTARRPRPGHPLTAPVNLPAGSDL